MEFKKFKLICEACFGRNSQSQIADYFMISRKTAQAWFQRENVAPWVEAELKPLIARKKKEMDFAARCLSLNQDDYNHQYAILNADAHYYDVDQYTLDSALEFISNQEWVVTEQAKKDMREGYSTDAVINYIEDEFLSANDIVSKLEEVVEDDDIDIIRDARNDALRNAVDVIRYLFDKNQ